MSSDTSLVFNLLGRDNISKVLGAVKNAFRSAGRTAEESMSEADRAVEKLDRQLDETKRDLQKLALEFAATGDKTLFGKMSRDRSLISQLQKVRSEVVGAGQDSDQAGGRISQLASMFTNGAGQVASFVGQIQAVAGSVSSVLGPIWAVVSAVAAMAGAFAALGPAVALAGGALGSLPGLLGGGLAAFGTLKLGLGGLSSEYTRLTTATGGGGGGGATKAAKDFTAANRAVESAVRGVTAAEKAVTQAQAEALAAQKAINDARETATKRMRDQALDLQSAQLDQKDAAEAVTVAQTDLNNALANGDPTAANIAAEALQRAQIAAAAAKNKVDDLTEANAQNAKKGVEGSDEVVTAKKAEADARQRVADSIEAEKEAEERLQDARKSLADQKTQGASGGGGGGGGGQQVTQLAPAAREFLNTIIKLRPALTNLRLDVQQKLFSGLATPLRLMAERWLPQLHKTLGGFASTFNGIAKTAFASVSKKSFIENMATGAEGFRSALGKIGKAVAGPLVDAFGRLAAASAPFVEKLGGLIADVITKTSRWIKQADNSGKLKSFFKGAADTLGKVWDVAGKVIKVVGQVIAIIYPSSKATGDGVLDSASNALTTMSNWLNDPKNQQKIRDIAESIAGWVQQLEGFLGKLKKLGPLVGPAFRAVDAAVQSATVAVHLTAQAVGGVIDAFKWVWRNAPKAWDAVSSGISTAYKWVTSKGGQLVNWVRGLPKRIGSAVSGMWNGIKDGFRSAINWIIGKWNNLNFTIGGGSFMGMSVPSASFGTPNIPYLAKGGTVSSAGMAVVGDRGPELVRLSRGAQVTPLRGGSGGGGSHVIVFDVRGADTEFGRLLLKILRNQPAVTQTAKKHLGIA
jgi:hypothetical protein